MPLVLTTDTDPGDASYVDFQTLLDQQAGTSARLSLTHQFRGANTSLIPGGAALYPEDPEWGVEHGANAATVSSASFGGTSITTAAVANNDHAVMMPIVGGGPWDDSGLVAPGPPGTILQQQIFIDDTATLRIEVGARPTPEAFDGATDNNAAFFVFDTSLGATWLFLSNAGGAGYVTTDTGVALGATATGKAFRIEFQDVAPFNVLAYIDDVLVATHAFNTGAAFGVPYYGVKNISGGALARRVDLGGISLNRAR